LPCTIGIRCHSRDDACTVSDIADIYRDTSESRDGIGTVRSAPLVHNSTLDGGLLGIRNPERKVRGF
jgi:hypothetical protein